MKAFGMAFRLSLADLRHEWILSTCLVMAVAAVLSPLLILFGLKFGTVEVLRYRLVQDPRNREIRPMVSKSFEREWFEGMAAREDVAFIIPFTRQISAQVDASPKGRSTGAGAVKETLDVVPTGPGDRLLLENGASVPGEGEVVLSQSAAEAFGVEIGDVIEVAAKRIKGSRYELGKTELTLTGVAYPRATTLKVAYVPLDFLEAVERYKDGQAVPELGWSGSTPKAYPVYDGVAVLLGQELKKVQEFALINNTGFSNVERVQPDAMVARTGYSAGGHQAVYLVEVKTKPAGEESLEAVASRLRGKGAVLVPMVRGLKAELLGPDGELVEDLELLALSMDPDDANATGVEPVMGWLPAGPDDPSASWRRVMLPDWVEAPEGQLSLRLLRGKNELVFPVRVEDERTAITAAFVPARLAGVCNLFRKRNVIYDEAESEFLLSRRGYAGFRLYAATIDDVDALRTDLEAEGIPVSTEAERIRDVVELDRYLTLIFLLIATVALIGGAASLMASLYASVERKRRDLAVLRLLGLSGGTLLRFPVYQGVLIAATGFAVAFGFFEGTAWVINTLFSGHLQAQESLCLLRAQHLLTALASTVAIAVVAGGVAAWRSTRIEPAEALRDE